METFMLAAFARPIPGREQEFGDWYENQHIPDIMRIDGFKSARRYECVDPPTRAGSFLTVYEVEAGQATDIAEAIDVARQAGQLVGSDSLDRSSLELVSYRAISSRGGMS